MKNFNANSMKEGFLTKGWNKTILAQSIVLAVRRNLIRRFSDNNVLMPYLVSRCQPGEITSANVQNIQRELSELLQCGHAKLSEYRDVVESVKQAQSEEPARSNESIFFTEIERVLRKYVDLNKQLPLWN